MKWIRFTIAMLLWSPVMAFAQKIDTSSNRVKTDLNIQWKRIGTIKPKNTSEITGSNWILGCETLDRDMTDYEQYKTYIAPLGIKRLRMQAGWAKTEKIKGQYDWAWLDKIVEDAAQRGFQPWLETGYGNPIYEGGGGINLSAGIPNSEIALKAWDNWVAALVTRYKDKITDWEVWNEPNFGDNDLNAPEKVAELNIRTAEIIKKKQPQAKISGLAMGHIDLHYADVFFKTIHKKGKMHLFDNMTYHDYVYNPDANYSRVADLRRILDQYAPQVKLRQGENGSPSFSGGGRGALGDYDWSELSQAKWNTRRMLGDLGHDIECSILGIVDMNYAVMTGPIKKMNVKGLLQADTNKQVIRPKMVYYAMQHLAAIFDDNLQRIKDMHKTHNIRSQKGIHSLQYNIGTDRSLSVYGYEHKKTKKQLFALWIDESIPTHSNETKMIPFTVLNGNWEQPVYVDILTGGVFEIPTQQWRKEGQKWTFTIPIYDAPILITDKSLIQIQ